MRRRWWPKPALAWPALAWPALAGPALAATVALSAVVAGCGSSAPTRLYTPEPSPSVRSAPSAYVGPPLRVAAVRVPPAWDRLEILREVGPGQLELLEFDRWAAPLGRSLRQVLVEDLASRLPGSSVLVADAGTGPADGATVTVDILSIRVGAGTASMQAGWVVRGAPAAPVRRRAERIEVATAAGSVDAAATARALSALMGELADRIAATLEADTGAAPVRPAVR